MPGDKTTMVDMAAVGRVSPEHDRFTVNLAYYYEQFGEDPKEGRVSFSSMLPGQGAAYTYPLMLRAGNDPVLLNYGHVGSPGYVIIESRVGRGLQRNPTPEEAKAMMESEVRVYVGDVPAFTVRPQRVFVAELSGIGSRDIKLAAIGIDSKILVNIIPR